MKRILAFLMALVMVFVFAACSGDKQTKQCSQCGNELSKTASFCQNCGAAVNDTNSKTETSSTEETSSTPESSSSSKTAASNKPSTPTQTSSKPTVTSNPVVATTSSETSQQIHMHTYSKLTIEPTCTEKGYTTYTCSCGDLYTSDYVDANHKYINYTCIVCGNIDENYTMYQKELASLTLEYNSNIKIFEEKIDKCNNDIKDAEKALKNANSQLSGLSPTCPQYYIQQYVNNWQQYGNTYAATQAAKNAWAQEYNSKKAQLNNTISARNMEIQALYNEINSYNSSISNLTEEYDRNVEALKAKYNIS